MSSVSNVLTEAWRDAASSWSNGCCGPLRLIRRSPPIPHPLQGVLPAPVLQHVAYRTSISLHTGTWITPQTIPLTTSLLRSRVWVRTNQATSGTPTQGHRPGHVSHSLTLVPSLSLFNNIVYLQKRQS